MAANDVAGLRTALGSAIENGLDTSDAVLGLLYAAVPFGSKFKVINFSDILVNNAQSAVNLKKMIQAVSILEKYARHLMKPPESRSNMWRHIKYSNNIFRERVNSVKGGRYVMYQMGYTENRQDGVAFPDGVEPNHDHILSLLTDLVLGRKEIEVFLENQHPNPGEIEQYLTPDLRAELNANDNACESSAVDTKLGTQGIIPNTASINIQHGSSVDQSTMQTVANQMRSLSQPTNQMRSLSQPTNQMHPLSLPTNQTIVQGHPTTFFDSTHDAQSATPNLLTKSDRSLNHTDKNQHQKLPFSMQENFRESMVPKPHVQDSQAFQIGLQKGWIGHGLLESAGLGHMSNDQSYTEGAGRGHISEIGQGQNARVGQSNVTGAHQVHFDGTDKGLSQYKGDMYSINRQSLTSGMSQQGQGQFSSPQMPVQQPRPERQSEFYKSDQNSPVDERSKDSEGKTNSIVCDICGDYDAVVICQRCDSKQLCKGCNIKWHNHPKRQNHSLEHLHTSASETALIEREKESLHQKQGVPDMSSVYTLPREPHRQDQFTYNPHDTMQKPQMDPSNQMPSPDLNKGPYSVKSSQFNIMSPSSHIATPSPTHPGGFMYTAQPSMMGMPGTMPYNMHGQYVSPPMMPSHIPQYPVSYMSNVYMHQQQPHISMHGYLTPVGSTNTDMQRAHNSYSLPRSTDTHATPAVLRHSHMVSSEVSQSPSLLNANASSLSSSNSESELLPNILAIPNLEKQMAKLEISIMTLKDDLQDWEEKINEIILQNPNFFQDEGYKNLNRKKRRHLQEINELQKYRVKLAEMLAGKLVGEPAEEIVRKKGAESQELKEKLNQMQAPGNHDQPRIPRSTGEISKQHEESSYNNFMKLISPQNESSGKVQVSSGAVGATDLRPKGPVTTTYRPETLSKQINPTADLRLGEEYCPPLHLNSLGPDLPEDIGKMHISEHTPSSKTQYRNTDQVNTPPAIKDLENSKMAVLRKQNSEPTLQQGQMEQEGLLMKKSQSSADIAKWQCEHCTYLNDYSDKACIMCYKTTDNPKRIEPNMPAVSEEHLDVYNVGVSCEYCTVLMEPGAKVCTICAKTQTRFWNNAKEVEKQSMDQSGISENESAISEKKPAYGTEASGNTFVPAAVGKLIEDEQDQVYMEKKAARENFEKQNKLQGEIFAKGTDMKTSGVQEESGSEDGATAVNPTTEDNNKPKSFKGAHEQDMLVQPQLSLPIKNVERLRKASSESSGSYNSAASSLEEAGEQKVKAGNQAVTTSKTKAPQLTLGEAIEEIHLKRDQEQMGHEIMTILKEGERAGYEVGIVKIALTRCIDDNLQALDWLKTKWPDLIDIVATMTTEKGKQADQNDIGDVSDEEVKQALIEFDGEIDLAVEKCVKDRKAKYLEISECGQYAREDILTALYQNHGDVEEAVDQLNHSVIQTYADRLWETNGDRGGDVMLAAAARSSEIGNSVSNSVIGHAGFQTLVSDTTIDKDRRVRLVFVEGKLKSWGRAETVVNILDSNITHSDDPLECTLEDIIEAVRNCGDRRSSLVYLTQECGVCFSKFPMSKIRDLGGCNCKLCQGCVKQYFEVGIREHYVRNWNCPLCEAPDFEDEGKATTYFEFLSLILQNLVSREVMDLYETKLRDWHLQKDPNFRWCAHCASGFLWVRPDILGMTCASCHRKTCFMCKIKWEEQHEGLTCEEFAQWKIDNDPEKQAKGVKLYLEENGIDCPSCKMRYSLAKGGCMHFKCPQCGYEFCSGCSQAFLHQETCKLLKSCRGKGLHCHHPRDCFYYMRDCDVEELQKLLKDNKAAFNTEVPVTQEDKNHCPVMEQKEYGPQKKDEPCGKDIKNGMAGLCEDHYKEYLVSLINKHKIDPVTMMSIKQMKILIERKETHVPKLHQNETEINYRNRIQQFIKGKWPLPR